MPPRSAASEYVLRVWATPDTIQIYSWVSSRGWLCFFFFFRGRDFFFSDVVWSSSRLCWFLQIVRIISCTRGGVFILAISCEFGHRSGVFVFFGIVRFLSFCLCFFFEVLGRRFFFWKVFGDCRTETNIWFWGSYGDDGHGASKEGSMW